eukprot:TRINITY_DN6473_c0_g1_i3.p1 TRINITY_DN6473_c0_g1~~TRINITY_DN6473_c0_g1_i3.p1  ORF type:complete len:488 (-),score=98.90 TRINITY_DN6473_c0_g1_i3:99-1562(-)
MCRKANMCWKRKRKLSVDCKLQWECIGEACTPRSWNSDLPETDRCWKSCMSWHKQHSVDKFSSANKHGSRPTNIDLPRLWSTMADAFNFVVVILSCKFFVGEVRENETIGADNSTRRFSITPEKLSQRAIELTEASQQQNTGENQKETELFDGKWLLNSNDLMAGGKCLGTGTYGAVYAVKRFLNELDTQLPHGISYTSEIAAIKKLNGLDYRFRELIDIRYETIMLRNMNSQLFVPFHGMYQDVKTKTIGLVYDYMHSGNVSMAVRGWGFVSIADKSKWALQLASALQLLHHQNPPIVHGSLSLNNLLLTDDLNACLMDFGMLGLKKQMQMPATAYNTSFLAPEILMGDDFSIEADMYALGICLWELFMGKEPHENLQPMEIATAVVNDIRPTLESHIEPAIAKLCRKLWRRNPEDRGTIDEVVRDLIAFEEYVSTELVGASTSIHGAGRATPSSARSNPFLVTQGSTKSGKSGKSNLTVDVERGR